jgi:sigma-B regulation protein RsbU (phosphoserine phosphatase)
METSFERDIEIARRIQASFLPEELPQLPGWELAASFQPARQVAGDFYDAFPLIQNRRLGLVIGDVCDKGVGAALFMALFRTLIRAFAQQHQSLRWMSGLSEEEPGQPTGSGRSALPSIGTSALKNAIELTNDYIANVHGSANMFATLFFGVLDPANGTLLFVNGGHEYPLLVSSAGVKERLATTGPLVGLIPRAHFDILSVTIEPGETLFAFTDGVTEAMNSEGELFGLERLDSLLVQPVSSAAELLDRVQAGVEEHLGGMDLSDDITMLALRRQE